MSSFNDIVRAVSEAMPDFNDHALRGLVEEQIDSSPEFIALVFREGFKLINDDIELIGYRLLTPEERVIFELKQGSSKQSRSRVPLTVSHLSLVRYTIRFRDTYIEREIYTPYIHNNMITIHDKNSIIKKVLLEKTFSRVEDKDTNGLSVSPIRVNMKFNRKMTYRIESFVGGGWYSHFIIVAHMWSGNKKSRICERTIVHYLLAKFGFEKTLKKFGLSKFDVSFVEKVGDDTDKFEYFAGRPYDSTDPAGPGLFLRVKRELMSDDQSCKFIVNLMYVLRFFSIQNINNVYVESGDVWKTILGFLLQDETLEGRAYNNTISHLRSADHFIDPITVQRFTSFGLLTGDGANIYDLLVHIFINIDADMANYDSQDIYDCRLDLSNILVEMYARKIFHQLYGLVKKTNITLKDVKNALSLSSMMFKPNASGRKDDSEQYLSPPDIVGDNYLFSGGLNKIRLNGKPEQHLHPSVAVAESFSAFVGKPIGKTGYINPYITTSPNGAVVHPDYAAEVDAIKPFIPR
jgi:hypothetical protein